MGKIFDLVRAKYPRLSAEEVRAQIDRVMEERFPDRDSAPDEPEHDTRSCGCVHCRMDRG